MPLYPPTSLSAEANGLYSTSDTGARRYVLSNNAQESAASRSVPNLTQPCGRHMSKQYRFPRCATLFMRQLKCHDVPPDSSTANAIANTGVVTIIGATSQPQGTIGLRPPANWIL